MRCVSAGEEVPTAVYCRLHHAEQGVRQKAGMQRQTLCDAGLA